MAHVGCLCLPAEFLCFSRSLLERNYYYHKLKVILIFAYVTAPWAISLKWKNMEGPSNVLKMASLCINFY